MTLPIIAVRLPNALKGQRNGQLDPALLASVDNPAQGRQMLTDAARAMRALQAFALLYGIILTSTGRYRPLRQQFDLFIARYEPCTLAEWALAKLYKRGKTWSPAERAQIGVLC